MVQVEVVTKKSEPIGIKTVGKDRIATTEEIIIRIFCLVDDRLYDVPKVPQAKLYQSEIVTIRILFALKGTHFRAFYRWLRRDFDPLFGGLPHRTTLLRQLREQQVHTDNLMAQPSVLNVADNYRLSCSFPSAKVEVRLKSVKKARIKVGGALA